MPLNDKIYQGWVTKVVIVVDNADTCQLQLQDGPVWLDVADTGILSGTNSNVLIIRSVTASDEGNQYRVVISKNMYICSDITSNFMTLSIHVNTVIINRKIACRINKK